MKNEIKIDEKAILISINQLYHLTFRREKSKNQTI